MAQKNILCRTCGAKLGKVIANGNEMELYDYEWDQNNCETIGVAANTRYISCRQCKTEYTIYSTVKSKGYILRRKKGQASLGMKKAIEVIKRYCEENSLEEMFASNHVLLVKLAHIKGMTAIAMEIAADKHPKINFEMLKYCALRHDDGRAQQFELLGNFNDRKLSHNALGADKFDLWRAANKIKLTKELKIIREVMQHHGRMELDAEAISNEAFDYVKIVSDADDIENGCIGAVGYLMSEVETDAKGYNESNPEWIGKIKPELFEYYRNGQWFNKLTHCFSNAEYVLFAATLAMKSIKHYGNIAINAMLRPCYGYNSAVEGYIDIFQKVMSPEDAALATEILVAAVYGDKKDSTEA